MRRLLIAIMLAGSLLGAMALPAAAHIHATVPARQCAATTTAANNPTARNALRTRGAVAQGAQTFPIGNAQGTARSEAAAHCQRMQ